MLKLSILVCVFFVVSFANSYVAQVQRDASGHLNHPLGIDNSLSPRLIGGVEVTPHAYPFQAALMIYKGIKVYFCGGSLISEQWVLTAASCVDMKPDYILVVLGAHNLSNLDSNAQVFNATETKFDDEWNAKLLVHDIGLVRLPTKATLNGYVNVVQIARVSNDYVNSDAVTLGWGRTETEERSLVLKQVTSKVISNDDCSNTSTSYKQVIMVTHLCTSGAGPKGSCSGDFGGPLLVDGVQVGINSFASADCLKGLPSVFTRLTYFYQWVDTHARDESPDEPSGANTIAIAQFTVIVSAVVCLFKIM